MSELSFFKQPFSKTGSKVETTPTYTAVDFDNTEREMNEASAAVERFSSPGPTPRAGKALKLLEEKRKKFYEISKFVKFTEADLQNAEKAASEAVNEYENTYDSTKKHFILEDMREKIKKQDRIYDALKGSKKSL